MDYFKAWQSLVPELNSTSVNPILEHLAQLRNGGINVFPPNSDLFNALKLLHPDSVSVIILGQDPYHQQGQAHGLAFSVPEHCKTPPSLRNIFIEINSDIYAGTQKFHSPNLSRWAKQGVLLLNTTLSVTESQPLSHSKIGWQKITFGILNALATNPKPLSIMLWGKHAQEFATIFSSPSHLLLKAAHPSPLSAFKGFFGCKHFSMTNAWLNKHGQSSIVW